MKQPKVEARRWLAQAESDLAFAELGLREGAQQLAVAIARRMVAVAHDAIGR
jgi:HEPN domain-containing protein